MDPAFITFAAGALFAYALVSKRLTTTPISGPMVFVGLGLAAYATGILDPIRVPGSGIGGVLELTLALLLFSGATRVHLRP